jgi:hypothetical protein
VSHSVHWSTLDEPFSPQDDRWWWERGDTLTVRFSDEGEYRVDASGTEHAAQVILGPADEALAALSFVLAVLPLSLPLFGLEPFHGAALAVADGSALLVTGFPEAGKSTTAAALRAAGTRFLADDACAIDRSGQLWPGPPLLSARSKRDEDERFATYDGKTVVAINDHDTSPRPVCATVVLRPDADADLQVRGVTGREAIETVLEQVRSPWVMPERRRDPQFHAAVELARHPVALVTYAKGSHSPDQVADAILRWAGGPAEAGILAPRRHPSEEG